MTTASHIEIPSTGALTEHPLWIGHETPIFAVYHPPAEAHRSKAVLFCAPFGWEDMASYAVRRVWAQRLAAAGHPVLRFDLPGTGQSAGGPNDDDMLGAWLASVDLAARWLRGASDASTVAAVGLGLGALLALEASSDEHTSLDELVLWNLPRNGKALTRAMRVFGAGARLINRRSDLDPEPDPAPDLPPDLPPGWIDCSGYTLSAATVAAIESLTGQSTPSSRVARVLLLERDAGKPTRHRVTFAGRLRERGISLEVVLGAGYDAMHTSPHLSVMPDEEIATIGMWLDRDPATDTVTEHVPAPAGVTVSELASGVSESVLTIEQPSGTLFGLLAEPDDGTAKDLCIVCLPAMAQRCIGPSRLWVELARRQATRGVPVLRVDLASVGESAGSPSAVRDIMTFAFDPDRAVQVAHVLDALEERLGSRRFILVGLSSAGYLAQEAGYLDERVVGVLSLNPLMSPADDESFTVVVSALRGRSWRRVLTDDFDVRHWTRWTARWLIRRARSAMHPIFRRSLATDKSTPGDHTYARLLDSLQLRGGLLTVGVAEHEPAAWFLERSGLAGNRQRWPALRLHHLRSSDHELRPLDDQRAVHALADDMVRDLLGSADAT